MLPWGSATHLKYEVLDVWREYVRHHGLRADDALGDVLLRVLVALDGEWTRASQQLVSQHAEAPPVDGLAEGERGQVIIRRVLVICSMLISTYIFNLSDDCNSKKQTVTG